MTISLIRPLIDLDTRLRDIPLNWIRYIEPNIMRGSFLPCWVWTGKLDPNGYPMIRDPFNGNGREVMAHRWVAKMFYTFPDEYFVSRTCVHRNCLNPGHLLVTDVHPRWLKQGLAPHD